MHGCYNMSRNDFNIAICGASSGSSSATVCHSPPVCGESDCLLLVVLRLCDSSMMTTPHGNAAMQWSAGTTQSRAGERLYSGMHCSQGTGKHLKYQRHLQICPIVAPTGRKLERIDAAKPAIGTPSSISSHLAA